jgi:protein-L-isoaspartate(D-aspartate) O-methyltransferase
VRFGDADAGWPERVPFDAIVVTAGADHNPAPQVAQLASRGRMVIPVGSSSVGRELVAIGKHTHSSVRTQALMPVSFVPLTRRAPC